MTLEQSSTNTTIQIVGSSSLKFKCVPLCGSLLLYSFSPQVSAFVTRKLNSHFKIVILKFAA